MQFENERLFPEKIRQMNHFKNLKLKRPLVKIMICFH